MPFNQQMTVPAQLTLRSVVDGLRLFAQPLSELTSLRGPKHEWTEITPDAGDNPLRMLQGDLSEITLDFSPEGSESLGLDLRGTPLVYDGPRQENSFAETCGRPWLVFDSIQWHLLTEP
jgi:fructan beta-fructosidase